METPQEILDLLLPGIEAKYLGKYNGSDAFYLCYTDGGDNICAGYPLVYFWNGSKATHVMNLGINPFDVLISFSEN